MFNTRPRVSMDLEATWAFLEEGIDHLMADSPMGSVSYEKVFYTQLRLEVLFLSDILQHMSLTTAVFNYCTSIKPGESSKVFSDRLRRRESGEYASSYSDFDKEESGSSCQHDGCRIIQKSHPILCDASERSPKCRSLSIPLHDILMRDLCSKLNLCKTKRYCGTM